MAQHRYRITVEPLADPAAASLPFETACHDDLAELAGKIERTGQPHDEAATLAVGLKLFGETLLARRGEPPFSDLAPHFAAFMQALKKS